MSGENMDGVNGNWFDDNISDWAAAGWDVSDISDHLANNSDRATETMMRVEYLVNASESLTNRLNHPWLERLDISEGLFDDWLHKLNNPMNFEEVLEQYENWAKMNRRWELALNASRQDWESVLLGEERALILARCDALDSSSKPQLNLLVSLMDSPSSFDEIDSRLSEIEQNEARQKRTVYAAIESLKADGYDVDYINEMELVDALHEIATTQMLHNQHELVRLMIIDELAEFDDGLAEKYEVKRKTLLGDKGIEGLDELTQQIRAVGDDLNRRLVEVNNQIGEWVKNGIFFASTNIGPQELLEWETNIPELTKQVDNHLTLVKRYDFFKDRWSGTSSGDEYKGYLEQTGPLSDVIGELEQKWKEAEIECISIIEKYQNLGLVMDNWDDRISTDPVTALSIIKFDENSWNARIDCIRTLLEIDVSFEGEQRVEKRILLLKEVDTGEEIIEDTEAMIEKMIVRRARHRRLLEREVLDLIAQGKASEDTMSSSFTLLEFENFVANARKHGSSNNITNTGNSIIGGEIGERIKLKIAHELAMYESSGWYVQELQSMFDDNPMSVAKMLNNVRLNMANHDALRRRLSAMPWNRNVNLALQIQEDMQNPLRLATITEQIPKMMVELSKMEVEEEDFTFTAWSPTPARKVLLPIPEQINEPLDSLGDAHEAILDAMEEKEEMDDDEPLLIESPEKEPEEVLSDDEETALELPNEVLPEIIEEEIVEVKTREISQQPVDLDSGSLEHLHIIMKQLGLYETFDKTDSSSDQIVSIRKSLAKNVGIEPRDVRLDRLLRLVLRLLPQGDDIDTKRKWLIMKIASNLKKYRSWVKIRLEARHKVANGNLLQDSATLGIALERIPGPGFKVPLTKDEKALPAFEQIDELEAEIEILINAINLQSASGVVVSAN